MHIVPGRSQTGRHFDVDVIVTCASLLIGAGGLVLIVLSAFALFVVEITSMIGNSACLMVLVGISVYLIVKSVIEDDFLVVGAVALRYAELVYSIAVSPEGTFGVGGCTGPCNGVKLSGRSGILIRVGIGIGMIRTRYITVDILLYIFARNSRFTGPYGIYGSLPVILLDVSACIEVSVNVIAPVGRCFEVNIIIIAVYINGAVGFVPAVLAVSGGIARPVSHLDCLIVGNISVAVSNLEVVAVVLAAVSVLSIVELGDFRTEVVGGIIAADNAVVDTEMCCFLRNRQLIGQITVDTVILACISVGFHQITGCALSDVLVILGYAVFHLCKVIIRRSSFFEELDMDVVPYSLAVAVEHDLLCRRGVAVCLFGCLLAACTACTGVSDFIFVQCRFTCTVSIVERIVLLTLIRLICARTVPVGRPMFTNYRITVLSAVISALVCLGVNIAKNILELFGISDVVITVTQNELYILVAIGRLYLPYNSLFAVVFVNETLPYGKFTFILAGCGEYRLEPISVVIENFFALTEIIGIEPCIEPSAFFIVTPSRVTAVNTACVVVPEVDIVVITSGKYPLGLFCARNSFCRIIESIFRRRRRCSDLFRGGNRNAAVDRCGACESRHRKRIVGSEYLGNVCLLIEQVKYRSAEILIVCSLLRHVNAGRSRLTLIVVGHAVIILIIRDGDDLFGCQAVVLLVVYKYSHALLIGLHGCRTGSIFKEEVPVTRAEGDSVVISREGYHTQICRSAIAGSLDSTNNIGVL